MTFVQMKELILLEESEDFLNLKNDAVKTVLLLSQCTPSNYRNSWILLMLGLSCHPRAHGLNLSLEMVSVLDASIDYDSKLFV